MSWRHLYSFVSVAFFFLQYIVAAEEQGVKPEQLAGTIQVALMTLGEMANLP
jgi:methylmalonyl-CoA mutase N-terminal domain/subunit